MENSSSSQNARRLEIQNMNTDIDTLNQANQDRITFPRISDPLAPRCRICISNNGKEPLISPCGCRGTMGMVHQCCIERWLETQNLDRCELCNTVFTRELTPKSLGEWLVDPNSRYERCHILMDFIIWVLVTPVIFVCAYSFICIVMIYLKRSMYLVFATSVFILTIILVLVYVLYMLQTIRYHYKEFKVWRRLNCKVRVLERPVATAQDCIELEENQQGLCNQSLNQEDVTAVVEQEATTSNCMAQGYHSFPGEVLTSHSEQEIEDPECPNPETARHQFAKDGDDLEN